MPNKSSPRSLASILALTDQAVQGKQLLIRVDFNVPLDHGEITSDARIRAALPTLRYAVAHGAGVRVLSHLGRPPEGLYDPNASLLPICEHLQTLMPETPITFESDWLSGKPVPLGQIHVCENVRFQLGEDKNDPHLARRMAALCDIFVMDAFGTAHRAQASTYGVAEYAPIACAGLLLQAELHALSTALEHPQHPVVAIVGGSKVSTKLTVLKNLLPQVDHLIVGGGIANTFLAAQGYPVGQSLYEPDLLDEARRLLTQMKAKGGSIPLPIDLRVAKKFSPDAPALIRLAHDVQPDEMILDIGPESEHQLSALLGHAKTILWNGPLGVFEFPAFRSGTLALAQALGQSKAFSLAGGGDTLAAIDLFGIGNQISYISTGGGAFLEFIEGKTLPAVAILMRRGQQRFTSLSKN